MKSLLLLLSMTATAAAQVSDIEVPTVVFDTDTPQPTVDDEEIDLANIVQSAVKGVTSVQEAPAIVTVVTDDEIRDRQYQNILQLVDTVPGWQRVGGYHSFFPMVTVRGQMQAMQFLQDGVSLFDPFTNTPGTNRVLPMELIKRVEIITGPGGVLWGSNSLLGILNVITKDAEDVEGVEVGSAIGHGDGDRLMTRAYVMAGTSELLRGQLKLFGHGSVESYQGAAFTMPLLLYAQPVQQATPIIYGPLTTSDQSRGVFVNLSGKATWAGKLMLRVQYPFGHLTNPLGLAGNPVVKTLPEDARPECAQRDAPESTCVDNLRKSRTNEWRTFDRFIVAEYRDRFANGMAGISLKGYGIEFVRGMFPQTALAPSPLVQGGLALDIDMLHYRVGGALDGDIEVAKPLRVLYGAEAFTEWIPDGSGESRQGRGSPVHLDSPYDLSTTPLPCPRIYDPSTGKLAPIPGCPMTFTFEASRSIIGAYINPQLRPTRKLILDAGARVQVAPETLGSIGYPATLTAAGTVVWSFVPNWYLKLNYAQGFRPPVFNNTSGNAESGAQFTGAPDLKVETSDAVQAEINARIFKGDRRIRELSFRLDGSYTRLSNLIQINSGAYGNSGDRAIASGELLGKLYVQGGHRLELAYTWMRIATADRGLIRGMPEHWFNFATVFNLVTDRLSTTTNLKIAGSAEDPNRLVEYRDTTYDSAGMVTNPLTVKATDLVVDKLPPIADLSLGVSWTPLRKLAVRAVVYNALLQHAYQPDVFFDYEPHAEYLPNPYEGFRAYLSALYQY